MNALQVFKNPSFGQLTVIIESGKELFKLEDVAWALGYTKEAKGNRYLRWERINNILQKLDISTVVRDGQQYVDESGLYDFIFESGTEKAREFRKWVTAEVLPTIRKTGGYVANDETFIETYLPFADQNTKMLFKATLQTIKKQNELIEKQKPLVNFAETCMASDKSLLVREVAKLASKQGFSIGEKRLYQKLREWGLIFKNKNEPYQEYVDRGYFEIAQGVKETEKGSFTWQTIRVTPKGQMYIFNRLKKESDRHATTQS